MVPVIVIKMNRKICLEPILNHHQNIILMEIIKNQNLKTVVFGHQESRSIPTQITQNRFDMDQFTKWMQNHGKLMYGSHFLLYSEDTEVLAKLYAYITGDVKMCSKFSLDLNKGIFLVGGVGVGKTVFMMILRQLLPLKDRYAVKPCQQIALEYIDQGTNVLMRYGRNYVDNVDINTINRAYCFDDLGAEEATKHYGNDANVMAQIIQMRYNLFQNRKVLTHFTSNLISDQIDVHYGTRVRSRLREMCNWIEFSDKSSDKRI